MREQSPAAQLAPVRRIGDTLSNKAEFDKREAFHRILQAAQQIRPQGVSEYKTHDAPTLSLYWRCVSTLGAILVLLDERYGEEALSLSRSLFNDSMQLLQIAEAGDARAGLTLGWMNRSYEEIKGLFKKARELGVDPDPSEALKYFANQQSGIQTYMRKHDVEKLRKFRSPEDAAIRYGRRVDYWTYLLAHEMVHGSDASFAFRREQIEDDVFGLCGQSRDPKFLTAVGAFAGKSVLDSMRAVSDVFDWALPSDYEELRSDIDKIASLRSDAE